MKTITKIAAGAAVACGLAMAVAAPADAGVRIGIGVPVPVVAAAPAPATCYDYYGRPYYCGYPGYYAPGFVGVTFGAGHVFHHDGWHR
jgi:hypothetical protein